MEKEMLQNLTIKELFILASEANSTNDQELVDMIADEFKERNEKEISVGKETADNE